MQNDIMDTLKGVLGDNAEEKIQSALSMLQPMSENNGVEAQSNDIDFSNQIKSLMGQMANSNDSRSNLLMSLKPYMRGERQKSIDNAVKILNLTRLTGLFK